MIKKTLYFGNPIYLSLKNAQLVIKLPGYNVRTRTFMPKQVSLIVQYLDEP